MMTAPTAATRHQHLDGERDSGGCSHDRSSSPVRRFCAPPSVHLPWQRARIGDRHHQDADDPWGRPCPTADAIAQARLTEVVQRLRSPTALKTELKLMVEGCRHGKVCKCRVIKVPADHSAKSRSGRVPSAAPCRRGL